MPAKMKKIETYLKKLAEKRARAAGDVERYSKATEQSAKLLARAQSVLTACDVLIEEYDERLVISSARHRAINSMCDRYLHGFSVCVF